MNILKRGDERWEKLAVRVYLFPNLAAFKSQWEYPILNSHIVLFFRMQCWVQFFHLLFLTYRLLSTLLEKESLLLNLPYFEPGCNYLDFQQNFSFTLLVAYIISKYIALSLKILKAITFCSKWDRNYSVLSLSFEPKNKLT